MTTKDTTKRTASPETIKKRAANAWIDARAVYDKLALRLGDAKANIVAAEREVTFRKAKADEIAKGYAEASAAMMVARDECVRLGVPIAEEGN